MLTGLLPERVDHRKMANQGAILEGSVPIKRFLRLSEMLVHCDGTVDLKLNFERNHRGLALVQGTVQTQVSLICQNCMQAYDHALSSAVSLHIVENEKILESLDESEDGMVWSEPLIPVTELVEDELLLTVPMIGRHQDGECPLGERQLDERPLDQTQPVDRVKPAPLGDALTYKPFADLKVLTSGHDEDTH